MRWNANRVEQQGIGYSTQTRSVVDAVRLALSEQRTLRAMLRAQNKHGLSQAADHLFAALEPKRYFEERGA